MTIKEILSRKIHLDKKLKDLNRYIEALSDLDVQNKSDLYNKAIEEKFALLSKIQSHTVLLQGQNIDNIISIGDNKLSVYDAVQLRNTLQIKIETLDSIISHGDFRVINIFSILQQRDSLFEEFLVLSLAIKKSDIETVWEKD